MNAQFHKLIFKRSNHNCAWEHATQLTDIHNIFVMNKWRTMMILFANPSSNSKSTSPLYSKD